MVRSQKDHGGLTGPGAARPYFDTFDGVRAFAVTAVVLFHTGIHNFKAGFLGVDVFFVLSGFLITSLILDEMRKTRALRLTGFFERRGYRIVPAQVVMCIGVIFLAVVASHHLRQVAAGALFTVLGVANIWHYSGHPTPLLDQTWTLSIEEQFYLLWPFLVLAAFRWRRPGRVAMLVGCLALWALIVFVPLSGAANAVRGTYVRASGLPLGCLLALFLAYVRRVPRTVLTVLCWASALFLLVAVVTPAVPTSVFSIWKISMGSVAGVVMLAGLVLVRPGPLGALFTFPAVKWLGRRSYAIYLWHFALLSLALHHARSVPKDARIAAALVATLVVAEVSWWVVETPFLRRKQRIEPGAAPAPGGAADEPPADPEPPRPAFS